MGGFNCQRPPRDFQTTICEERVEASRDNPSSPTLAVLGCMTPWANVTSVLSVSFRVTFLVSEWMVKSVSGWIVKSVSGWMVKSVSGWMVKSSSGWMVKLVSEWMVKLVVYFCLLVCWSVDWLAGLLIWYLFVCVLVWFIGLLSSRLGWRMVLDPL